jgi:hypothetical protein
MSDPTLSKYADSLAPAAYDKYKASMRRKAIETALANSSLRVGSMFESGSWTHGTGISAKSDVDYMAVAAGARPRWPSSALETAKNAVKGCYEYVWDVRVSSPVIAVQFTSQPQFEIAPAWFKEKISGFSVYQIAGRSDEWVLSAPGAHLDYVNRQNDRLGKKVKPLIRLLKAWKHHAGAPVSSFYLEMRTAEYAASENAVIYDIDLRAVVSSIIGYEARDMNDPAHIVGRIPACASDDKRRQTLRLLRSAKVNLQEADAARQVGDQRAYWRAMSGVFGDGYPWPTW